MYIRRPPLWGPLGCGAVGSCSTGILMIWATPSPKTTREPKLWSRLLALGLPSQTPDTHQI